MSWLEWLAILAWAALLVGIVWFIFKIRKDNED